MATSQYNWDRLALPKNPNFGDYDSDLQMYKENPSSGFPDEISVEQARRLTFLTYLRDNGRLLEFAERSTQKLQESIEDG